ncbi:DNA polymerase III subunit psi [Otariodibacter oris]|uniref:DNA polymerase III subunit psi n=1 Tax=Otariodibacter oris TaxID=1032623 RepID=A0A420XI11_9PAST|nr:DNA polymerase III subunit psi [Otariodibacter oris]QGM81028.1 DNA polymerase III subunit psi [Otariodibacter oris]RKR76788.1 DNA polymerase III psi subunit [Otariodibacter oris]
MNRRDLLLHEMNIPQWILTKPQVLKGDAQIRLEDHIKLVIVCDEDHQQTQRFQDILLALKISNEEYQWINFSQSMRLNFQHSPIFWIIQDKSNHELFAKKYADLTAWYQTDWNDLSLPPQKRQFWQQIESFCPNLEENS